MTFILWVVQLLLALAFLAHANMMLKPDEAKLRKNNMAYVVELPAGARLFVGGAELLAVLGLLIPAATHIATWLTPLAALGLLVVMLGSIVFHIGRREYPNIALNVLLGALAAFVAWGRFGAYHF